MRHFPRLAALTGLLAVSLFGKTAHAQCEVIELVPDGPANDSALGDAAHLFGQKALVGAPESDLSGEDAGAAYVFRRDGASWIKEATLFSPTPAPLAQFGEAVSLSGSYAAIGTPRDLALGNNAGSVDLFFFDGDQWSFEATLRGSDTNMGDRFGSAVALSGTTLLVGAPFKEPDAIGGGRVYVFEREPSGWVETGTLLRSAGTAEDLFGEIVELRDSTVAVSARRPEAAGRVHVFSATGGVWTEDDVLTPDTHMPNHEFGASMDYDGNKILVSSPAQLPFAANCAYVFEQTGGVWSVEQKLELGGSSLESLVGLSGDKAVIGFGGVFSTFEWNGSQWISTGPGNSFGYGSLHILDDVAITGGSDNASILEHDGSSWVHTASLDPNDQDKGAQLGYSIALEGDLAVLGAVESDPNVNCGFFPDTCGKGHVEIYRRTGGLWEKETELAPVLGNNSSAFGYDVSLSGDLLLASHISTRAVYAYRYDGQGWPLEQIIEPLSEFFTGFGQCVAVEGDRALIGSTSMSALSISAVTIFFEFDGTQWVQKQVLKGTSAGNASVFGWSVDLKGDLAVVGAREQGVLDTGAVYVFEYDGSQWVEQQLLRANDNDEEDEFGYSVATDGELIVVGATDDDEAAQGAGAVYVFERVGGLWTETAKIVASDANALDEFGYAVAIEDGLLWVGAPAKETALDDAGATYVYRFDGLDWIEVDQLDSSGLGREAQFGAALDVDGSTAMVGAPLDDPAGSASGSVRVYDLSPATETTRLGTPPNPAAFLEGVTGPPVVGTTWAPVLDHSSFVPDAVSDFAIITAGAMNLPLGPQGTLLCDVTSPLLLIAGSPVPGAPFALPIPNSCPLIGTELAVQGGSFDSGFTSHLANAIDIVIGAL